MGESAGGKGNYEFWILNWAQATSLRQRGKKILSEYEKGKNDDDIRKRLETLQETLRERLKNGEGNSLSKKASGCKLG